MLRLFRLQHLAGEKSVKPDRHANHKNDAGNAEQSVIGREEIRRECFDMLNNLIIKESGKSIILNLLFTSYLYD